MRFTHHTQVLRGSAVHGVVGRSFPAFYSLRRRGAGTHRSLGVVAKIFQPRGGGKGGDNRGDDVNGVVSGWTGKFGGFEPLSDRNQKDKRKSGKDAARDEEMTGGPLDSDDFDAFESFAEAEALKNRTVEEAQLDAVMEDDWPRLTAEALAGAWREWRRFVLQRMGIYALWLGGILFASTGLSHYVGRHFVNNALPWMSATVSQAANRPIRIGRCKGLWPAGLLGCGSFLDVGPLVIGPAESERSIVEVAKVRLSLRPIASLLQFKIVVSAHLEGVQATLRQGENGSWLGYPEDTLPLSARPTISIPKRGGAGVGDDAGGGAKLALESVRIVNGTASLHLAGDSDPRLLKRMNGTVNISPRGRLELDMQVNPVSRGVSPSERPVTMKSDVLPRHLRAERTLAEKRSLAKELARGEDGGHIRCFLSLLPANNTASVGTGKAKKAGAVRDASLADLKVRVQLNNTSAAVVERTIPGLPIDITTGRVDGELRLRCNTKESWAFPDFGGQIRCRGVSFHFWDGPDDFADTDVDLVFEGTRMYLHGGKGFYGSIPLKASGDMDLAPGEKNTRELKEARDRGNVSRPQVVQPGSGRCGEYRISAQIAGVDLHDLRETLGVRPPPRPLAGAIRGFLYIGGPLEYPIFTGSAETIPPKPEDLNRGVPGTEAALAEDAVRMGAADGAVAAYDCLAVKDARAVFTVDTWSQKMTLHEAEASPAAGGVARASGTIRVDAGALSHPEAVDIELEAEGFDPRSVVASLALKEAATIHARPTPQTFSMDDLSTSSGEVENLEETQGGFLSRALPSGLQQLLSSNPALEAVVKNAASERPDQPDASLSASTPSATFGLPQAMYDKIVPASPGSARATITGPHAAPTVVASWEIKDAGVAGDLKITRNRVSVDVRAPAIEFSGAAETSYPPLEVALAGRTIDDSLAAGRPTFTEASVDMTLRSLDLAALVVSEDDLARLAPPDRLRLRLSGSAKVNGKVEGAGGASAASLPTATPATIATAREAARQFAIHGIDSNSKSPYVPSPDGVYDPRFSGEVSLEGLRMNQLLLAPRLAGEVKASIEGVSMDARGRADEHFRFQLKTPAPDATTTAGLEQPQPSVSMSIHRGLLKADMEASDGRGNMQVAGLRLDDLELASLRGRVERAKLSMDLREKIGAATLRVQQPRLSGMQGEVLDADALWDGRIVRLERAALDQRRSKYTLQGEHCLDDSVWLSLPSKRPVPAVEDNTVNVPMAEHGVEKDEEWVLLSEETSATPEEALEERGVSNDVLEASTSGVESTETSALNRSEVEIPLYPRDPAERVSMQDKFKRFFSAVLRAPKVGVDVSAANSAQTTRKATEAALERADDFFSGDATTEHTDEAYDDLAAASVTEQVSGEDAMGDSEQAPTDYVDAAAVDARDEQVTARPEWVAELTAKFEDEGEQKVFAAVSETKPSSNSFASVMDRLAAIKLKVTEGGSSNNVVAQQTSGDVGDAGETAAEVAAEPTPEAPASAPVEMDPGAWRLRLAVPQADVEEMLPAVRLAAALREGATPLEYTRAKDHFLEAVRGVAIKASEELGRQLDEAAAAAAVEQRSARGADFKSGDASRGAQDGDNPAKLPGLQDLRGAWRGTVEMKGGGAQTPFPGTALNPNANQVSAVDFNVSGDGWSWGSYQVQSLEAQGNVDAVDGLHMRRLELRSDGATIKLDGNLFGEEQNAAFAVIDLPAQRLAPIVHHIASAASASNGLPPPPPPPLPAIAGTLFVSGDVGGSFTRPTGSVRAHLSDGKIGAVRMGHASASAEVTPARTAKFHAEANPASSNKRGAPTQIEPGHLRLSGVLPLPDAVDRSVTVDWSVQDGGMQLVSALSAPSLGTGGPVEWLEGGANITLTVRGTLADPIYDGAAVITRAKIVSPLLARPLYPVNANVRIQRNTLYADMFDAKCGPRGSLKIRGAVPVLHTRRGASGETWEGLVARADVQGGIRAEASGLDIRARAVYSGRLDADIVIKGTLLEPEVGGSLRLSKGTAFLQPNAAPAPGTASSSAPGTEAGRGLKPFGGSARRGLAGFLQRSTSSASDSSSKSPRGVEPPSSEQLPLRFNRLRLIVGPELSAVYPFVLNFGVSGEVEMNGVADPALIRPSGVVNFERGDINLVATQVRLSREHPNRAVFVPEHGLDPTLDVSLVGADLRALVQGKASTWTDNLVVTSGSSRSGGAASVQSVTGGGTVGGKTVGAVSDGAIVGQSERDAAVAEAARIFEGQLAESLLEEDGQLAFSNLAASTVATLMPKIETGGQLGKARWRVTTAPSIPGLLSLDPGTDPFRNISQFTLGSDWELMLGDSLQATMSRKLKENEMQTNFALVYKLTDKLRMQLNSESSAATRLLFEFTTNANPSNRGETR